MGFTREDRSMFVVLQVVYSLFRDVQLDQVEL